MWWLGVSLEILSTVSGTIGKQLIRYSELRKKDNPHLSKVSFYSGLAVNTMISPAIDMAAYSFAAQSLIAPFGGLDVVWNALAAPYMLQEKLTARRLGGCILIIIGTVGAGAFGSHEDRVYTVEYLEDTLVQPRILIYFACFFVWFLVNVCILQKRPRGSPIRGVSLGCTAGSLAGNLFCLKAAVEIIQYSINENTAEPWKHWLPYVMLLGAAFFAISNVKYMTQGLQECEALFMVTVYEGAMIVSGCVSGAVVLKDLQTLAAWRIILYSLSVMTIVLGMVTVFSNEMMNKSSLASGKASIAQDSMEEIKNTYTLTVPSTPKPACESSNKSGTHVCCMSPSSSLHSTTARKDNSTRSLSFSLSLSSPSTKKGSNDIEAETLIFDEASVASARATSNAALSDTHSPDPVYEV